MSFLISISGETLILPRFTVVNTKRLSNEINGVTVALIERGTDAKSTRTATTRTSSTTTPSPRSATKVEKSTNSGGSSFFTYFVGLLLVAGAIAVAYHLIPDTSLNWPLPKQDVDDFYSNLKDEFSTSQPQLASNLRVHSKYDLRNLRAD